MRKLLFLILLIIISSSCTAYVIRSADLTKPTRKIIKRDRKFNNDFDDIWQAVVSACAETGVSIKVIEQERGVINAEKSIPVTEELSEAFDTGKIVVTYDKKKPAVWYDSTASKDWIAARGKTVESNLVELDLLSELKRQNVFAILSYNIFVEKLENNNTNVIINIFAYPAQPRIKLSPEQIKILSGRLTPQVIEVDGRLMPQTFELDISRTKFLSKGKLEDNFFTLIEKLIKKGRGE